MSLSNEQQFLRALTKLSKKHGLYVGGCGCFGSPYLYDGKGRIIIENLETSDLDRTYTGKTVDKG